MQMLNYFKNKYFNHPVDILIMEQKYGIPVDMFLFHFQYEQKIEGFVFTA